MGFFCGSRTVCPYCDGASRQVFAPFDFNQRTSASFFKYFACMRCGLIFIGAIPHDLKKHYRNEQYDIPGRIADFIPRSQSQQWKVDILTSLVEPGSLLEVGPATGEFAFAASQAGFNLKLLEMDKQCCVFLRDGLKLDVVQTSDPASSLEFEGQYDAICIWQAIEHIPEFWKLLDIALNHLKKSGVILLSTPNPMSLQAKILRGFWPHIDAPRHLYLIPQAWFQEFAKSRGLSIVMNTTCDVGSLGLNYYGWYLAFRNLTRGVLADKYIHGVALKIANGFRFREELEGCGCSYTIAFRKI